MGLFDDLDSRFVDAKRQIMEAAGLDAEETKQNLGELKQGFSGLGKQLTKCASRILSSSQVEEVTAAKQTSLANETIGNTTNPTKKNSVETSNSKQDETVEPSVDDEIRMIEGKLERLRKKRDEAIPEEALNSVESAQAEAHLCDKDNCRGMNDDTQEDSRPNERPIEDLPPIESLSTRKVTKGKCGNIQSGCVLPVLGCVLVVLFSITSIGVSMCGKNDVSESRSAVAVNSAVESSNRGDPPEPLSLSAREATISIACRENWFFSQYDVDIYVDDEYVGNLEHGSTDDFSVRIEPEKHELRVVKEGDPSVDGAVSIDSSEHSEFRFSIHCRDSQIEVTEFVHVQTPISSDSAEGSSASAVETQFRNAGFDEISMTEDASLSVADSALAGTIKSVTIDGDTEFAEGSSYYSDAPVEIIYYSVGDIHPSRNATDYEGMAVGSVRSEFEQAGFINIEIIGSDNGLPADDSPVDHVEIGWLGFLGFTTSDTYSTDEEVRIYVSDTANQSGGAGSIQDDSAETLTVDNCEDLRTLLSQGDTNAAWFASQYDGETIEFDAYIGSVMNHGDYDTRYDILVLSGNAHSGSSHGPNFRFSNVNTYDLGIQDLYLPHWVTEGQNVHVVARVDRYDSDRDLFLLDPIMMTER